jgi:Leucine-rich repeat (LRR) protein
VNLVCDARGGTPSAGPLCVDSGFSDGRLDGISSLTRLQVLSLKGNKRLRDLSSLSKCVDLEYLSLNGTSVDDAGVKCLAGLKSLTALDLTGTRIATADSLPSLANLEVLKLNETQLARISGLEKQRRLKRLELLQINGLAVVNIAGHPSLQELFLEANPADENSVGLQVELKKLEELTILHIKGCRIATLALEGLPRLEELHVAGNRRTPESISLVGPSLLKLHVTENTGLKQFELVGASSLSSPVVIRDNPDLATIRLCGVPFPRPFDEENNGRLRRVALENIPAPRLEKKRDEEHALTEKAKDWKARNVQVDVTWAE